MANTVYDSFINPIKFHQLDNVQPAQYVSRFMDDWAFRRTIQPWEQKVCFYAPWGPSDSHKLQYTSDINPIIFRLHDENGYLIHTQQMDTKQQDELQPTFYIRQIQINLSGFDPGKYFYTRDIAGSLMYSEPFEIKDITDDDIDLENQDPTLYIEFSHYETYQGIKFFVPFEGAIRIPGIIRYKQPASKDNIYEDQRLNQTMINAVPFRIYELLIGGNYGVPPFFIDKISRILGCSNLKMDGRLYTKHTGAEFEPIGLEDYPMQGWKIEMREKLNRDSVIIENDTIIEGVAAAALLIDNKGFGIDGGDTTYQEINYLR
jgi:hypothetical protein